MTIETERLRLSPLEMDDVQDYYNIRGNAIANRYQGWIPKSDNEVLDFIVKMRNVEFDKEGSWYQMGIRLKETDELIGDIAIHFIQGDYTKCEIGATISTTHQGKGIATEALKSIIELLFRQYNKEIITASIDPRNIPSIKMIEKLGFKQKEYHKKRFMLRGEYVDDLIFQLIKA